MHKVSILLKHAPRVTVGDPEDLIRRKLGQTGKAVFLNAPAVNFNVLAVSLVSCLLTPQISNVFTLCVGAISTVDVAGFQRAALFTKLRHNTLGHVNKAHSGVFVHPATAFPGAIGKGSDGTELNALVIVAMGQLMAGCTTLAGIVVRLRKIVTIVGRVEGSKGKSNRVALGDVPGVDF